MLNIYTTLLYRILQYLTLYKPHVPRYNKNEIIL